MTKNDIIRMAREAGFEIDCCSLEWHERIQRFADLVALAEREACAKVIEHLPTQQNFYVRHLCAAAIRARSNT